MKVLDQPPVTLADRIRALFEVKPDLTRITAAQLLHMSLRSLARKLSEEGIRFSALRARFGHRTDQKYATYYERRPPAYRAQSGERFGLLTTIGVAPIIGDRYAIVRCECGDRFVVLTSTLRNMRRCSIRCASYVAPAVHRPGRPKRSDLSLATALLNTLEVTAAKRLLPCSLTVDDLLEIRIGRSCTYCETPIDPPGMRWNDTRVGLDRIDGARGYDRGNVLACCTNCNIARGHLLSVDEFHAAISHRRSRLAPGDSVWPDPLSWRKKAGHLGTFGGRARV